MPAKKKPAPKAPAKPATKAPAKPAPKAQVKAAQPAPKPSAKPVTKAAKPAPQKSPPVKKAPAKTAKTPAAKKAAETPVAKKAAPKAAEPAKKAAPAKAEVVKPAPADKKAAPAPKAEKAAPAPKAEKAAPAPKAEKAAPAKAKPAPPTPKITNVRRMGRAEDEGITMDTPPKKPVLPAAFLKRMRQRLVELRDAYLNSAEGVTAESLRGGEGGDSSAFGMHQADAGSDAYDRDFALSLLAKEQDAIYEINEALKRIDAGMYGICEMSGETIPEERLEALPFTRFTVSCQERLEREQRSGRWNRPVRSLFGLDESGDDADDDRDEEESSTTSNSNSNESLDFSKE
ncbi:TraR/DksA family transcriptional regulator [Prosthecobacter dejongeii]|uniref:RNA polymerase-binding transcription factor DksA n=1 Tax=Prosthecobacter dejongeii TaxID=48465 RepID=A0A7W7YMB6_9BACT|nr:TraR/DksA C4-type zinc finger protein [Prosthecobacter dejongeii]MBB5038610.1 RNA polymerase-binding transcription factor DksA [Prosthecobacter dejongeii]